MIVTTTNAIEGRSVSEYHGIVTGEAVMGANIVKDLFSNITDVIGGRSGVYEKELRKAREIATEEMTMIAKDMGANAVIGCDIDYEVVGSGGSMLMVSISGTAVTVR